MMAAEKIEGLANLRNGFSNVASNMKLRTSRSMVVSAGGVLKKEAKAIAQSQGLRKTGALIKNIAIKREKTPEGIAQYNLGVRHGKDLGRKAKFVLVVGKSGRVVKKRENDPFYWSFLEFTTKRRSGTPFIGRALENKRAEAIQAMEDRLQKSLDRARL